MTTPLRQILIVDDSEFTRDVLRRRLTAQGYAITEADSGERAVEMIRQEPPDLVLLDLEMPELDGIATLIRIRTHFAVTELPVLILSAREESHDIIEALSAGANDFVTKSNDFSVITARIQTQLALRRLTERIQRIAVRDELTGLYNRRGFQELADREEKRHRRFKSGLQAILIDLDHFKKVNDAYGHKTGDLVLARTAQILEETLRATDLICRWGGEEFAVLLPQTDLEGAVITAERLRSLVERAEIRSRDAVIPVTISAGVAPYDISCADLGDLMRHADKALYEAKRQGPNQVCICREQTSA